MSHKLVMSLCVFPCTNITKTSTYYQDVLAFDAAEYLAQKITDSV